jgi:hypothetical protein
MTDQPALVTTTTANLATILGATLPFAGHDWDHPGLYGVRLDAANGIITATATNRYVLGHARKPASGDLPRGVFLDAPSARLVRKTVSRAMKARQRSDDAVTITATFDGDSPARVVVDFLDITIRLTEGQPIKHLTNLDSLLAMVPGPDQKALSAPFAVAPYAIEPLIEAAKWGSTGARNEPLRWSFVDPHKPARVEIEDWFVAAVMPIKTPSRVASVPTTLPRPTDDTAAALQPAGQG